MIYFNRCFKDDSLNTGIGACTTLYVWDTVAFFFINEKMSLEASLGSQYYLKAMGAIGLKRQVYEMLPWVITFLINAGPSGPQRVNQISSNPRNY
jgi:hypothetical protein